MRASIVVVSILMSALAGGCWYSFEREADVPTGVITGRATRADAPGQSAAYATVEPIGFGVIRRANSQGGFNVTGLAPGDWLLRLGDDVDGNGWPERTQVVAARVGTWSPPLLGVVEGILPDEVVGISLGDVPLEGTVALKGNIEVDTDFGTVAPAQAGLLGRVYVVRDACFVLDDTVVADTTGAVCPPLGDASDVERLTQNAEAVSSVDASGVYAFEGVAPGRFFVVAALYRWERLTSEVGELLALSPPIEIEGSPQDVLSPGTDVPAITFDGVPLEPVDTEREIVVDVGVEFIPDLIGIDPFGENPAVYATFGPPGKPLPPCLSEVPDRPIAGFFGGAVRAAEVLETSPDRYAFSTFAPVGAWDIKVCSPAGEGILTGVVVLEAPTAEAPPVRLGPVRLFINDPCASPIGRDCDGDGLPGLLPLDPLAENADTIRNEWTSCVDECVGAIGTEGQEAVCTLDRGEIDCDDDGDGQPDVTEDPACYGPGLGTDLDGDGLCAGEDPFPRCAANTPEQCDADTNEIKGAPSSIFDTPICPVLASTAPDLPCAGGGDPGFAEGCTRFGMACDYAANGEIECTDDSDCREGVEHCRFQKCIPRCECPTDAGFFDCDICGDGEVCVDDVCLTGCDIDDPVTCGEDENCLGAGFLGDACFPAGSKSEGAPCQSNVECGAGMLCISVADQPDVGPVCNRRCDPESLQPCPLPSQECTFRPISQRFVCRDVAVDLSCTCTDRETGQERRVQTQTLLPATCDDSERESLWLGCDAFFDTVDAGDLGEPVPPPDGGVEDAGPSDGGVDDAGLAMSDAGTLDAGTIPTCEALAVALGFQCGGDFDGIAPTCPCVDEGVSVCCGQNDIITCQDGEWGQTQSCLDQGGLTCVPETQPFCE
jgi:hypothetical protein